MQKLWINVPASGGFTRQERDSGKAGNDKISEWLYSNGSVLENKGWRKATQAEDQEAQRLFDDAINLIYQKKITKIK